MNNIKKLKGAKKVLIVLDLKSIRALDKIATKTRKSKSYLIRDAIKHTADAIDMFSEFNGLNKKQ
jgi:predicted transcriptional regulator